MWVTYEWLSSIYIPKIANPYGINFIVEIKYNYMYKQILLNYLYKLTL